MLAGDEKKKVLQGLKRVEGQVGGLHRMVSSDSYCIDVLLQVAAAQGALGRIAQTLLASHIDTCVRSAFTSGDQDRHSQMIRELMDVFGRYAKVGPPGDTA